MVQQRRSGQFGGGEIELPNIEKKYVIIVIGFFLAVWLIFTSFYTVGPGEVGVVQRFGKYYETTTPGLHFKMPFGIDNKTIVNIERPYRAEFGFRTREAGIRTQYARGNFLNESLMLSGDLNSAVVEWIVQYKVKDPVKYLFNVRRPETTIHNVSEAVMRRIVGDNSVDEVLIINRELISQGVRDDIQKLLDEYETGIHVVTVNLQDVNPPEPVQPAFNAVNEAKQERERIINEAQEAYNKVIPQARGEAEQLISEAQGYAINRVNRSKGDAEKFLALHEEYKKAKDVTRRRLYIETMLEIMPKIKDLYIVDEGQQNLLPLLQLQKQPKGGGK